MRKEIRYILIVTQVIVHWAFACSTLVRSIIVRKLSKNSKTKKSDWHTEIMKGVTLQKAAFVNSLLSEAFQKDQAVGQMVFEFMFRSARYLGRQGIYRY